MAVGAMANFFERFITQAKGHPVPFVQKWTSYLPAYEQHFAHLRGAPEVRVLELGVQSGGSLRMWLEYFGPTSSVAGADVDPRTRAHESTRVRIFVGDVGKTDFLQALCTNAGPFDMILDDASHFIWHQRSAFTFLYHNCLRADRRSVYVVEDIGSNYYPKYGGNPRLPCGGPATFMSLSAVQLAQLMAAAPTPAAPV